MQKIMLQVVEHKAVKVSEEGVGTIYRQKFKEGKRIEEYDKETLGLLNTPTQKKLKVGFTLAKMFEITAQYELEKLDEHRTFFTYTVTNRPLKTIVKFFMLFASDKVVVEFVQRVKKIAESESKI
jgi:hypothetical protein